MGLLDEPALERLIATGCAACGAHKLVFSTMVDGSLPLMGGEPVGRITWIYDGEKFIDGVYHVGCAECQQELGNRGNAQPKICSLSNSFVCAPPSTFDVSRQAIERGVPLQ